MYRLKSYDIVYLLTIIFTVYIYIHTFKLNVDSIWILHCANEMLNGATLYIDKIDVNPPLIFLYSTIAIKLSDITNLSSESSYITLVLVLIFSSIYLIYNIIKNHYTNKKIRFLLYSLLFILTISTTSNFGEREHIFIIFVLPYIFMQIYKDKIHFSRKTLIYISIFAALGFNLKPHFFILFFSIELFNLIQKKNIKYFFRIDVIIIVSSAFIYLLIIYLFFIEYLTQVIPLSLESYTKVFNNNFYSLLVNGEVIFTIGVLLIYSFGLRKYINLFFTNIVIISIISLFIVYILQQKGWSYHRLPLFLLAQLFCLLILFNIKKEKIYFVFLIPIYLFILYFNPSNNPNYISLKKYINSIQNNKTISIISMDITQGLPLLKKSQIWASRYASYFMFPSVIFENKKVVKKIMLETTYKDLLKYNPDIIIFQNKKFYDFFIEEDLRIKKIYNLKYIETINGKFLILVKRKP